MGYSTNSEELIEYINKTLSRDYKNSSDLETVKNNFLNYTADKDTLKVMGVTESQFYYIKGWIIYIQEFNKKLTNKEYNDTLGNVIKENDWVLLFNKDNNPAKWSAEQVVNNDGILCTVFHKSLRSIYTDLRTVSPNHLVIITTGGENQIFSNDSKIILK